MEIADMSNIQRLASQIEVSAKLPTFGVCATSDPRVDEQSRQRCVNIIEMTDLIESFTQLQVGTGLLSLDGYLGALEMLGYSFDSAAFTGALTGLYGDIPSLDELASPGSLSAFDALIGSALLGGSDLIGELPDLADLFSGI